MSNKPIIVIDPGHGGTQKTGGSSPNNAAGANGLLEKNLTLDMANRVAASLAAQADVFLTRAGDTNLGLSERAKIAREKNAAVFLSIHFNGFGDTSVDGTEAWVAKQANQRSRDFAKTVLGKVVSATKVKDRGVREGDLGVLLPSRHASGTSACLLEISFLSNPAQARQLENDTYRQNIADAIIEGVRQHLSLGASTAQSFTYVGDFSATLGNSDLSPDEIAQHAGYKSHDDYVKNVIKPATLFGLKVEGGIHPDFYKKLQQAEDKAKKMISPTPVTASDWGITGIRGYRGKEVGWHGWGLAIDIDYAQNPYIMHEAGEAELDKLLKPVYHRIAWLMLNRESVIPDKITKGTAKVSDMYDQLLEESNAMKLYFKCMLDQKLIQKELDRHDLTDTKFWKDTWGINDHTPTLDEMQEIMMRDYVTLAGEAGPAISGKTYPDPKVVLKDAKIYVKNSKVDVPFDDKGKLTTRKPEYGFLTIKKEIVLALTGERLRWGAMSFGKASGDVMHFDDGDSSTNPDVAKIKAAKTALSAKATSKAKSYEQAYENDWSNGNGHNYAAPLNRPAMTVADVKWAADNVSPDYRHLGVPISTTPFDLTAASLERLCEVNNFDPNSAKKDPRDRVLFALRGCQIAGGKESSGGFVSSVKLVEAVPDHQQSKCVVGVWKRSTREVAVFLGSTVPYWKSMENYRQGGDKCNMLSTGRYLHTIGTHRAGHATLEIKGAVLQQGAVTVVRTLDDLTYEVTDTWDFDSVGDNIHPTRHPKPTDKFSSEGCVTVVGTYDISSGKHTGLWSEFRQAAGLTKDSAPSNEDGYTFVFVLLTGREARLINESGWRNLTRLRYGSTGVDVETLQVELANTNKKGSTSKKYYTGKKDGDMRNATTRAFIEWQQDQDGTADGIVTPAAAKKLGVDIINHLCLVKRDAPAVAPMSNGNDSYTAKAGAHYDVRSDILVTKKLEEKMEELAKKVYDKTGGHKITYSSGYRTPFRQARAMYDNAKEKGVSDFDKYTAEDLVKEIKDAYLANKEKDKAIAAMEDVIKKQVDRGRYISRHLRSGAVDVSSVDKSHYDTIKKIVSDMGGSSLNEGDHLHVQF